MMELLKMNVKPFARVIWLNQRAKESWSEPMRRIARVVYELEILSVAEGEREVSWQTIGEEQLIEYAEKVGKMGLVILPVRRSKKFKGFAHYFEDPQPGEPANISVVVAKKLEKALEYKEAYLSGDNETQGKLLGFPKCDREFFEEVWGQGYFDPIWQIAKRSEIKEIGERYVKVKAHPFSNPLLRYVGIRVGFHIPHKFNCKETIMLAKKRLELLKDKDVKILIEALLRMPMRWEVLHGVAIIKTPIFQVVTSSVPTKEKWIVDVEGDFYPEESSPGVEFPNRRF